MVGINVVQEDLIIFGPISNGFKLLSIHYDCVQPHPCSTWFRQSKTTLLATWNGTYMCSSRVLNSLFHLVSDKTITKGSVNAHLNVSFDKTAPKICMSRLNECLVTIEATLTSAASACDRLPYIRSSTKYAPFIFS